jgi:hypothetical protein
MVLVEGPTYFAKIIDELLSNKQYMRAIAEMLSNPQINKLEEMRKIEGSNYGIHGVGLYDPAFLFLHRVLVRLQKENHKQAEEMLKLIK